MNEQVERLLKFIPLITIMVYVIGYIGVSVNHGKYGLIQADLFNIQYLRVGLLILFLSLIPILSISINYVNRTDDIDKTKYIIAPIFHRAIEVSTCTIIFLNFQKLSNLTHQPYNNFPMAIFLSGITIFIIISMIDFYLTSYAARNIRVTTKTIWYTVFLFSEITFLVAFGNESIKYYLLITFIISFGCFIYLGLVADGTSDLRGLGLSAVIFIIITVIFSKFVLPGLPETLGGFESEPIKLVVKQENKQLMLDLGISINNKNTTVPVLILAESQGLYVVETELGYVQIKKDYVVSVINEK